LIGKVKVPTFEEWKGAVAIGGVEARISRVNFNPSDSPAPASDEQPHGNGFDDYFGVCPHCHRRDGFINIRRGQWFYCREHKLKWWAGSNLFSSWRDETEEEQRKIYDELGFGEFKHIDPDTGREVAERPPPPLSPGHYNLGNFLRTLATPEPIKDWSLTSLKEKLIKIGAKIVSHGRYVAFQMAEVAIG
jgi:hypothetical protein